MYDDWDMILYRARERKKVSNRFRDEAGRYEFSGKGIAKLLDINNELQDRIRAEEEQYVLFRDRYGIHPSEMQL
jgi:hypothetical protein